jgi:hypothetical protein
MFLRQTLLHSAISAFKFVSLPLGCRVYIRHKFDRIAELILEMIISLSYISFLNKYLTTCSARVLSVSICERSSKGWNCSEPLLAILYSSNVGVTIERFP